MSNLLIRAHALFNVMTEPKNKKDMLSVSAKTYLKTLAKQEYYNYTATIDTKYFNKGIWCEQDSIDLYNSVFFTMHEKNTQRIENDWLTGECDILSNDRTIDIKSAWSLATFPATPDDAHKSEYEWQGRAYMMLYNRSFHEVAYCLVSTPFDLIGYEDERLHDVDYIDEEKRITRVNYERDLEKENQIKMKCEAAQEYYIQVLEEIKKHHEG